MSNMRNETIQTYYELAREDRDLVHYLVEQMVGQMTDAEINQDYIDANFGSEEYDVPYWGQETTC